MIEHEDSQGKAAILMEALPYVRRFRGSVFVVKYGGSFMDSPDPAVRSRVAQDLVFLHFVGIKVVVVHGGGKAEKSYLHARDLARAIHLVSSSNPNGEIYNVGPENPTSIKEVVERCANALNLKIDDIAEISEDRLGQDSRYWLDSNKISNEFGWKQEIFWDEGLKEMVEWGEKYLDDIKNLETGYILRG